MPDPGFDGYIIVNKDNIFEGYMVEMYHTRYNPLRFVTGVFVDDDKLAFYKLTASEDCAPLMYVFKDGISSLGEWAVFDYRAILPGGAAKVSLEEMTISDDEGDILKKIEEVKKLILGGGVPGWNEDLIGRANELVDVLKLSL
jgi:hypothetical protein